MATHVFRLRVPEQEFTIPVEIIQKLRELTNQSPSFVISIPVELLTDTSQDPQKLLLKIQDLKAGFYLHSYFSGTASNVTIESETLGSPDLDETADTIPLSDVENGFGESEGSEPEPMSPSMLQPARGF